MQEKWQIYRKASKLEMVSRVFSLDGRAVSLHLTGQWFKSTKTQDSWQRDIVAGEHKRICAKWFKSIKNCMAT